MENVLHSNSIHCSETSEAYKCHVVNVSNAPDAFSEVVKRQLTQLKASDSEGDFVTVTKVSRNSFLMYSKSCSKVKKKKIHTQFSLKKK